MLVLRAVALGLFLAADETSDSPPTPEWQVLQKVAAEHGKSAEVEEVVEHLQAMLVTRKAHGRLSRVEDVLAHPWSLPGHSADLCDLLRRPLRGREADYTELVPGIADWLDLGESHREAVEDERFAELWEPIEDPEVQGRELLEALSDYVAEVHAALDEEWALTEEQRRALDEGYAEASEAWYRSHFPTRRADEAARDTQTMSRYQDLLAKTRHEGVLRAAAALMPLTTPEFQTTLAKRLARTAKERSELEGFEGDVRAVVGLTEESRVVLGGRGKTRYAAPAALIIDLGGKDHYARAAVVDGRSSLVQIVIDINGDDVYEAEGVGPVRAVGGVALLIDQRGDDRYVGGRHSQASSAAGFAMLVDREGNDVYEAEDFGQAYAMCGISLLYDLEGDDRYQSWAYTQGSGNGSGFSALVDVEGDDEYVADGHWPDVYGDSGPDSFHGGAQGFNLGFRSGSSILAGGIAALADLDGDDRYQAGNFSQGGGYFFGYGLMYDGGGDDHTLGYRYAQGFGVHQAVGMRWDAGGDDHSRARSAANLGSAWDEGVGWFVDDGGNDVYEAGGLALGGAAQTGVAVLLDRGGTDTYRSGGGAGNQGGAGSSEYHQKQSVGFLLDLGGEADQYSREGRGDGISLSVDWVGLFLDSPATSIAELLEGSGRRP